MKNNTVKLSRLLTVWLAVTCSAWVQASTNFISYDVGTASNWSNGLAAPGNPGTIAADGTLTTTGLAAGEGTTVTHTDGTLTGVPNLYNNGGTVVKWTQKGGVVSASNYLVINSHIAYELTGSGLMKFSAVQGGSRLQVVSNASWIQSGGTTDGVALAFENTTGTVTLSGGSGVNVGASWTGGAAFRVLNSTVSIRGDYSATFNPVFTNATGLTNGILSLEENGVLNFSPAWNGFFTQSAFKDTNKWQEALTQPGVQFGGVQVTAANFDTFFKVTHGGATVFRFGSVPPEAAVLDVQPDPVSDEPATAPLSTSTPFDITDYNVVYDEPATNGSAHSMPLGNGSVGLNAWIEPDGTLSLYISHTDSLDVDGHLIKIGKAHFRPSINPLEGGGTPFRQVLHLEDGTLRATAGESGKEIRYKLWVDAHTEVVHVEMEGDQAFALRAENDPWRATEYTRARNYTDFTLAIPGSDPAMIAKKPDTILPHTATTIGWYTDTGDNPVVEQQMEYQGLDYDESEDILKHRVFGALIANPSAKATDDMTLVAAPAKKHHYMIHVKVLWPASAEEWESAIVQQLRDYHNATGSNPDNSFSAHAKYWQDFWQRSWIKFSAQTPITDKEKDDAYVTTRAYNLQRYITACMGKGRDIPMQFNGGIFTYDSVHVKGRANVPQTGDYRSHGPSQWWQNTRFPYIALCAAGDTEFMRAMIDTYGKRYRKFAIQRAKRYAGVNGLVLSETMVPWGAVCSFVYGGLSYEQRGGKPNEKMFEWNAYLKKHFNSPLEISWYMLDYADHTGDTKTTRETIIPFATDSLRFFHEYYSKNDESGKMLMENANALESWWNVTNPAQDVAGLIALCERLLATQQTNATAKDIKLWKELQARLPELPIKETELGKALSPYIGYKEGDQGYNFEVAELYAMHPYKLITASSPEDRKQLGINAYLTLPDFQKTATGWSQMSVIAATLGMMDELRIQLLQHRIRSIDPRARFPAFWNEHFDWMPDQCHGGTLAATCQLMVMQTKGKEIALFPSVFKEWNADIKLHAPFNTVVEAKLVNGEVRDLKVTPESRAKDVILLNE